ncbi:MAG: hypothetical protein AB7T37_13980 [Dehalococcoidia bacterium]
MRALYEDVHLPFEVGTVAVTAQPAETAIPAAARTLAPTGTEDATPKAAAPVEKASETPAADARRVA